MVEAVEVKVRQVGNALGVILPSRIIREEKIRAGESIKVAIFVPHKADITKLFGMTKGAKPFVREHGGRN
ncbi:MAG: hypothetical protein WC602_04490 [archaeon]